MTVGKIMLLGCLFLCLIQGVISDRTYYMDSPTTCNQKITVADEAVILQPRGPSAVSNPPSTCIVTLESSYQESNYKFEILVESASFRCEMSLDIYDGPSVGSAMLQKLGCSSASTLNLYSKDRSITIRLTRPRNQYEFGSHFSLRIKAFREAGTPTDYVGSYRLSAGAIIGIVFGVIVLIAFAILMGWCYKTGRLGIGDDTYPATSYKGSTDNVARSEGGTENNFVSWNMRNEDKMSISAASRSNFDLSSSQVWDNLMSSNASLSGKKEPIKVDPPKVRTLGINGRNNNGYQANQERGLPPTGRSARSNNNDNNFDRFDSKQLSHSPGSRIRGRINTREKDQHDDPEYYNITPLRRGQNGPRDSGRGRANSNGASDNKANENKERKRTRSGMFENPDEEGYLYDYEHVQKLSSDDVHKESSKPKDFQSELQDAIKRNSMKRSQSDDAPGAPNSQTGLSSASELEKIDFSDENTKVPGYKPDTKGSEDGPAAQSSPKSKKKRRKNSRDKKSRKNKDDPHAGDLDTSNEETAPKSPKSKHKKTTAEEVVPPEAYAPIFSEDDANIEQQNYYPTHQYQPGHQGGYPIPYDPRYPMGMYPFQPGMPGGPPAAPYQQAGQAHWYVENTPTGQQKMAFAMRTHTEPSQSSEGDVHHPGMPGYTSTPHYPTQYGSPKGHRHRSKQQGMNNSLVPAGTILDDPQIPAPGTSLARYDDDPLSGIKTSQVVWTDAKPDPTDPDPDSACQVTRKTITRVTTRATHDDLPDAPNPSLQDMSFRTAQQLQATGEEPAFMSPTRGAPISYPPAAIQYNTQTPERSNSAFYTNPGHAHTIPGSPAPAVIHQAPNRNDAIKDRIHMPSAESSFA